ncbi:MAG: NAD(P)/FAD-dependent oxidoreductase [Cytophagales bacterium]|nr:NAD(P)/FAD-dependent oxidoreductase [Cytophagales bacterium]
MTQKRVVIVGGGLAGLVAAAHLAQQGVACRLVEKRTYPFHRVCGEYISNEVIPYLDSLGLFPAHLSPTRISRLQLTSTNGRSASLPLDLGGFGVSRYQFDFYLLRRAQELGVTCSTGTEVSAVSYDADMFTVTTNHETLEADVVIGCFGKRSKLDKVLDRSFMHQHSPYVGVKYHIRLPGFPADLIALHNFKDGYCGISRVEDDTVNLCYLTHRKNVKASGNIRTMEESTLYRNPFIREIFTAAEFLFEKPETINEISFDSKAPVEKHILMAGDAAGMITPLCGNGMAIAIHSAKLVSECVLSFCRDASYTRQEMESAYAEAWKRHFSARLWSGRQIQRLFGDPWMSNLAVNLARGARPLANFLLDKTHGQPF